jgi:hypothetical protein
MWYVDMSSALEPPPDDLSGVEEIPEKQDALPLINACTKTLCQQLILDGL